MTDRPHPPRPTRAEPREVLELKSLKTTQPELASAVDMQIELVDILRRVQARVPLPWIQPDAAWLREQQRAGRPAVRFGDIPLEWSDFRLALRQIADVLHRHEAIEREDHEQMLALSRDGNALAPLVTNWYTATSKVDGETDGADVAPGVAHVLLLSLRPVSRPLRRVAAAAGRLLRVEGGPLSDLRLGTGLRADHAERRATPDLRPLRRAVALRSDGLSVLRQ